MDVLQFIASLVGSVAWPAAACAIVITLRRPLAEMLRRGRLKRLKAGPSGVEVEYFDEKLQEARSELAEAPTERAELAISPVPLPVDTSPPRDDFLDEMRQLAEVSPSAAILESFSRLERVLRDALEPSPDGRLASRRPVSIRTLAREALEQGLIAPSELAALEDVTVLRNIVAHSGTADIDAERALSYAKLVRQLIISISLATGKTVEDGPLD